MDVRLSPEQQLLADASADLATELAARWALGRGPDTTDPPVPDERAWRMITDAGWLALRLPEADGGSAASCLDVCVVVEQLGRRCLPAPVIGPLLLVEQLRLRGAAPELLLPIAAGERRASVTLSHDLRRFASVPSDTRAWDCAGLDVAIICGEHAVEYSLTSQPSVDLTRGLGLVGDPLPGSPTPLADPGDDDVEAELEAFALAVVSADLLGVMQAALDASVVHARSRSQFGAPIGSYQAIAHLAAECLVSVEASRSAIWYAAWAVDELEASAAREIARSAKAFVAEAAIDVTQAAIQIHGGMGMTWEARPQVWLRRAQTDRRILGDEHAQYAALAAARFGAAPARSGR